MDKSSNIETPNTLYVKMVDKMPQQLQRDLMRQFGLRDIFIDKLQAENEELKSKMNRLQLLTEKEVIYDRYGDGAIDALAMMNDIINGKL